MSDSFEKNVPEHVAFIMDGNGRWAKKRSLPRIAGHKQGAEAARRVTQLAADAGIQYITLFGFSSENWKRPKDEIQELMKLLRYYLRSETAELHKNNARLRVIGDRSAFDADIIQLIKNAEKLTENNDGITVVIALNYGGRHDIAQATQRIARAALENGTVPSAQEIENQFAAHLFTAGMPEPDLMVRTSGEHRISNFLLWQCSYAEFFFTETLWPDFGKADLDEALSAFAKRDRRFGGLTSSAERV
ncbi:MAG: isoprenyl transferase [Micavibrio sp.]|nr:isoprenyl transferase [Micavibrio sp.]